MKRLIRWVLNRVPRRHIQRVVHIVTPIAGLFYRGRGVECPVCGRRYRKFMPYGYVRMRENALCPSCLSLERHRMLWIYLRENTDFFESRPRMLHIAPERSYIKRLERYLAENYVTADLESPLARVKMDVQNVPFGADEFDVVFCNHILEHVDDDRLAMREIYRVMKPGGWGVMLSPVNHERATTYEDPSLTTPEERERSFGQRDHVREYGLDYPDRLAAAGFEVESIPCTERFSPEDMATYGLMPDTMYIVRKPLG